MNIQFITRRPLNRAPTISTELLTSTRFHALIPVSFAALRMTQNSIISKTDAPEPDRSQHSTKQRPELRDLLPFVAGGKLFGVFAEDADGTAESPVDAGIDRDDLAAIFREEAVSWIGQRQGRNYLDDANFAHS